MVDTGAFADVPDDVGNHSSRWIPLARLGLSTDIGSVSRAVSRLPQVKLVTGFDLVVDGGFGQV